jgi:hypothetical protein
MSEPIKTSFHPIIEELQNEFLEYYNELREKHADINFQMFYSPFYENADMLILGFNPGMGNPNCFDAKERRVFQYLNDRSYPTTRDTNYVFEKAGVLHRLNGKVVKSNIFYLATNRVGQLYTKAKKLNELPRFQFYTNHYKWTQELVSKSSPKIIILEGINTYWEFKAAIEYEGFGDIKNFMDDKGVFSCEINIGGKITPMIGYHRRVYGMLNKDGFASLLATTF